MLDPALTPSNDMSHMVESMTRVRQDGRDAFMLGNDRSAEWVMARAALYVMANNGLANLRWLASFCFLIRNLTLKIDEDVVRYCAMLKFMPEVWKMDPTISTLDAMKRSEEFPLITDSVEREFQRLKYLIGSRITFKGDGTRAFTPLGDAVLMREPIPGIE